MKWFRFYHDAIDDPKVQRLPGDLFKFWVNMLCLASRSTERGVVKLDVAEIAFAMRLDDGEAEAMLAELERRNLLEQFTDGYGIHNWDSRQFKSDDVAARVAKHRENVASDEPQRDTSEDGTLQETFHATAGETLKPSVNTDSDTETDTEAEERETGGADAPPKPKRAHRIPEDFSVTDDMLAWAADKVPDLSRSEIDTETEKFVDHFTGSGAKKLDWVATWRNWLRRSQEYKPKQPANITPLPNGRRGPGRGGYTPQELVEMGRKGMER